MKVNGSKSGLPILEQASYHHTLNRESAGFLRVAVHVENDLVRHGLNVMLGALPPVRHVRLCAHRSEVLELARQRAFDLLILGLGGLNGAEVCVLASEVCRHDAKVLVLIAGVDEEGLDLATAVPCNGFLVQDELTAQALDAAISGVVAGDVPMPSFLANRLLSRARADIHQSQSRINTLTPREREVLDLLVEGLGNKQIALRLHISQHGVKRLVSNVLAKLNCSNRTLAVAIALRSLYSP
ncbi:response regulator transcription factor [Nonomuraea africana]|uniref:DNA-binding NarL/FixJ family response regulator n=1 Tax=Nonomuraea africana TaxID=46171 RepID=A0ABR9KER2_9ACTN|nr:response regulator transcription factor [Nonomuraea africana]MBE1560513.1 DNA-binding NarL/FixJ family response regulator [Nonomuraea africana]